MSIQFSPVLGSHTRRIGKAFETLSVDLGPLGERASPIVVLDDFRVSAPTFGPHPHAGFSAVTYVFEDSKGDLRSRDSLGNDIVMGPGGIVWSQAGAGMMHEELPAQGGQELHGAQIFVNLSSKKKFAQPQILQLRRDDIPEWRNETGDRVRVAVGSFKGVSSPLVPAEPFGLLDVQLQRRIDFHLPDDHNALLYVNQGEILVQAGRHQQTLKHGSALALHGAGGGGNVTIESNHSAQLLILSGAEIHEEMHMHGPFIMNDRSQISTAFARFQAGEMGRLDPLFR